MNNLSIVNNKKLLSVYPGRFLSVFSKTGPEGVPFFTFSDSVGFFLSKKCV